MLRLRGLPLRIGVGRPGRPDAVYYDFASLPVIGTHPLHAALFGDPRTPSYRQGRRGRPYRSAVRGRVTADGVLRIRTAKRTVLVSADAATRFTNRPVYEPVREGQRLRVTTLRCGARRVADRVTFKGETPTHEPYRGTRAAGGGLEWPDGRSCWCCSSRPPPA